MIESETLKRLSAQADSAAETVAQVADLRRVDNPPAAPGANLALKIFSFSFHRSVRPEDESGNGGGFIFDARGLPNPGREDRFKPLTGKDAAVADYLTAQASVREFLASATSMVELSVNNYLERGFHSLMVGFGCTGGRHRSVYLAEALARQFRGRQGLDVAVRHVEMEKLGK